MVKPFQDRFYLTFKFKKSLNDEDVVKEKKRYSAAQLPQNSVLLFIIIINISVTVFAYCFNEKMCPYVHMCSS